jgi:hypothetical protein
MIAGVRGRLITATFAQTVLPTLPGAAAPPAAIVRAIDAWWHRAEAVIGPASGIRAIGDAVVVPLLRILGFDAARRLDYDIRSVIEAISPSRRSIPAVVVNWAEPLDRAWRPAVLDGVRADARWCFCCNGIALRIVDAQRTWTRQYLEFDLRLLAHEPPALGLLWSLARADALSTRPPLLDRAADLSARHGVAVRKALGSGVLEALASVLAAASQGRVDRSSHALFEDALNVLYRILFLLFAEARGLVPMWHPVYRDRYSIEAIVATLVAGRRYRGIWQAVQAISRLVSAGCTAGDLRVTAFNGRLFSSIGAATIDRSRINDEVLERAVLAVSTTRGGNRGERVRIAYRDLDVEQLGAVYEHVLEYEPVAGKPPALGRTRDARKSSGTFYTPRAVTAHLVRRTLEPLLRHRSSDAILRLRVLDPAMGSGAFLVGACRHLAAALEDALIREGRWHPGDISAADRVQLRREIAQRCLFGVDLNPMAVQLARLSLWLATLAFDKPLTFLDHHLVAGDSLVGAAPEDIQRQPSRGRRPSRRHAPLPLFESGDVAPILAHAAASRLRLASEADDSVSIVRGKEKTLADLQARDSPLGRWSQLLDLWCAGWFWEEGDPPEAGAFGEACSLLLYGRSTLPERVATRLLEQSNALAARCRFLHWPLAFPEVFSGGDGERLPWAGFDAVIGNPPWDMVRGDSGEGEVRAGRRMQAHRLTDFVREAGIYRVETRAHVNRYRLFVERALQLVRPGGRVGLVLPSGVMTDAGAAPLRRHLFDRADVDAVTGLDNRSGIFPIHRSVRFSLLTCTAGRPTSSIACRFGISRPDDLESPGDRAPLVVTRSLLARISGDDDLALPEMAVEMDLRILEKVTARLRGLGAPEGWHVRFGRELNASDDRDLFIPVDGRPDARLVLEGKHIDPFRVALERCRYQLRTDENSTRVPRRARLAYRDVASATNRLTLIAAVVPAGAVTTHTLFCLTTPSPAPAQHALCGLLNSFVANYLARMRVSTHVTASLMSRLPVPVPAPDGTAFARLHALATALAHGREPVERMSEYAELQALAARQYELTEEDFAHILATFPLVSSEIKSAALACFNSLH